MRDKGKTIWITTPQLAALGLFLSLAALAFFEPHGGRGQGRLVEDIRDTEGFKAA